jgi:c-di-GMP-binding flagellar brake protein YcgR
MLKRLVNPGDGIELTAVDRTVTDEQTKNRVYLSKVYDVISDEQIEIMMPMEQSKLILLPIDGEYTMCFFTKNGLYLCTGRVIERYKNNNVYTLLFELTSDLKRRQRREYYRYACILPLAVRKLVPDETEALTKGEYYIESGLPLRQGTIVDISGGGLRFVGANQYEQDSVVFVSYDLPTNGTNKKYEIIGRVLMSRPLVNQPGEFEHRIQYTKISKQSREEIIRYIFEQERKNRNKEKG